MGDDHPNLFDDWRPDHVAHAGDPIELEAAHRLNPQSLMADLLLALADRPHPTSDEQLARSLDLYGDPRQGWAKRASDLRRLGYTAWAIDDDGGYLTEVMPSGRRARLNRITRKGWETVAHLTDRRVS